MEVHLEALPEGREGGYVLRGLSASGQVMEYGLPEESEVHLVVYDLLGREVAVLVDERQEAGRYAVTFDGSGLPSGVYSITGRGITSRTWGASR